MGRIKAGIIGCGNISGIYLKNLTGIFSNIIELKGCADLLPERAEQAAKEYGIRAYSTDEILNDEDIKIIINLTIPLAHAEINLKALHAGKHVYCEKPLAIEKEDGLSILELAESKGLLVGCAPDTFMGAGIQTCRKLIDDGCIGKPVAAMAFMVCHGHESWHPDPEFYYKYGGGPMFDMGPYYLTALVNLIGPVKRVTGSARITFPQRTITSKNKYGQKINVDTPTHIAGVLDFENGAVGTIVTSFDIWGSSVPRIEIHGTEGSLSVPDPNTFGGPVKIKRMDSSQWDTIPLTHKYEENSRGLGVADLARQLLALEGIEANMQSGQTGSCAYKQYGNRASGKLAYHVLELFHGFLESSASNSHYFVSSNCIQPSAMPTTGFDRLQVKYLTENSYLI